MRPTNEERREVAAKLRELPIDMYEVKERWEPKGLDTCCEEQTDYYLIHFALFGCFPADNMHLCDYEELHDRLADLIEPEERTCHDMSHGHEEFRCSECGTPVEVECDGFVLLIGGKTDNLRFCPFCGARVVPNE